MTKMNKKAFTLIEILLAIFIFGIIVSIVFRSFSDILITSRIADQRNSGYGYAQACMSRIVDDLEAIYISVPPIYVYKDIKSSSNKDPFGIVGESDFNAYGSVSKISFTSYLAHLPFGKEVENKTQQHVLEKSEMIKAELEKRGISEKELKSFGILDQILANSKKSEEFKNFSIITYFAEEDPQTEGVLLVKRSDVLLDMKDNKGISDFDMQEDSPVVCENVTGLEFVFYDDEGKSQTSWDSESSTYDYATPRAILVKLTIGGKIFPVPRVFLTKVFLPIYREGKS